MLKNLYSDKVLQYFNDEQRRGVFADGDDILTAKAGSMNVATVLQLQVKLKDNVIVDSRYQVYGNPYAIAVVAYLAEWVLGKSQAQLLDIDHDFLMQEFALPVIQKQVAVLAIGLLEQLQR